MNIPTTSTLAEGTDWTRQGSSISGKGDTAATFRGIQADLNFFADQLGFEAVKVDGVLGPKTLAAVQAVVAAVAQADAALTGPQGHASLEDIAGHAVNLRSWLEVTAREALKVGNLRRYHRGQGKEWNVKDAIAYGAGAVHEEFKGLQADLNKFSGALGYEPLDEDGFIGAHTAAAVKRVYDAVVAKRPMAAMTSFPVPDTKEETAEYAMFIRAWLRDTASKTLLVESA